MKKKSFRIPSALCLAILALILQFPAAAQEVAKIEALIKSASDNYDAGKHDAALADLDKALDADPTSLLALSMRGSLYRKLDRLEDAVQDFSKVLGADPEDADTWYGRGLAYFLMHDYESAIFDFTKVIKLKPDHHQAYMNRANCYASLDKTSLALADYSKAISLDPSEPENYYNRGLAYRWGGQFAEAIADLDKYIKMMKGSENIGHLADGYYIRSMALFGQNDYAAALKDANEAISLNPKKADFYKHRASIYRKLKEASLAEADEKKAAQLDPPSDKALVVRSKP